MANTEDQDQVATFLSGAILAAIDSLVGVLGSHEITLTADKRTAYLWFVKTGNCYRISAQGIGSMSREAVWALAEQGSSRDAPDDLH